VPYRFSASSRDQPVKELDRLTMEASQARMRRMKRLILGIALCMALETSAQVDIRINVPLPTVRFEAPPPLVTVEPGIQVVPDHADEIFFVNGVYWYRRDGRWFRSRDHRGGWAVVEERGVPSGLVRIPPGKYRHWRAEARTERREDRHEEHERRERRELDRHEDHERREGDKEEHGGKKRHHDDDER
jgi:hypothetical protein